LKCLFVSDLHGDIKKYKKLFSIIETEKPDGVFIGGDLLPNQFSIKKNMGDFIIEEIFSRIKKVREKVDKKIRFFIILGNDDPRIFEKFFIKADKNGVIDYINEKTAPFDDFFVTGYAFIPPTPFHLKDWERFDVSRFVDVGAVSPEEGIRTVDVSNDTIRYSTISQDLKTLMKNSPVEKTIFLFHSPPYNSNLDRAALDNKSVDHAPLDIHVGSIAIQRFIDKKQPFLTLHGHVHESVSLTGIWKEKKGKTFSFSAAHEHSELAIIRFDTNDLENASRELVKTS